MFAATLAMAFVASLSERSLGAGICLVLLSPAALGILLIGWLLADAPAVLRRASAWLRRYKVVTFGTMAAFALGSASGLSKRAELNATCDARLREATAMQAAGRPAAELIGPFDAAAAACGSARRGAARDRANVARAAALGAAQVQARALADQQVAAALAEARRLAAAGDAVGAIASFRSAAALRALDDGDERVFAEQLRARGRALMATADWAGAVTALEEARDRDAAPVGGDGGDDLLAKARSEARAAAVRDAVKVATEIAADTRCNNPDDVLGAWASLREVQKGDAMYRSAAAAVARLERCRKAMLKTLVSGVRGLMKTQRETMARDYETTLLREGHDVRVRLSGSAKDRITIVYVLFNRAWAYQITDGGSMRDGSFLDTLQDAGFKRVTFSDGFYESYSYDLDPVSATEAAKTTGLAAPFKL